MAHLTVAYQDDAVTILHGDARDQLPAYFGDFLGQASLLLTDPPYGVEYETNHRARHDRLGRAPFAGDGDLNALRDLLPICDRLMAPDALAFIFAGWQRLGEAVEEVSVYWPVKNVIVWDKGEAGTAGDLEGGYGVNWEAIIFAAKGRRHLSGPRPRAIMRYDWSAARDPVHPTVKPVGLMSRIISQASKPGELVLDPFCGSGPVLRAAKDLGRKAVGVEIEQRYVDRSIQRVGQELLFTLEEVK